MRRIGKVAAALLLGIVWLAPVVAGAQVMHYSPVTDARLLNPEPQNWLMY
ncbi:MAG: hypothetical protein HY217_13845, partial [Candidatus Rokubacteria bacterium]|nr:hypothetical protein [Candidatus Rokubacteria bacterium]